MPTGETHFERVTGRDVTETFDTPDGPEDHHAFRYERDGPEPIGERARFISGDECLPFLYDEMSGSLREAAETIAELRARLRRAERLSHPPPRVLSCGGG